MKKNGIALVIILIILVMTLVACGDTVDVPDKDEYVVTIHPNNGDDAFEWKITDPIPNLTYEGYVLEGFYADSNFTSAISLSTLQITGLNGNIDVYVKWKKKACEHDVVIDAAVPATCTEKGLTEGKHCSICDEVILAQIEVPALGHTSADAVKENEIAPTCTTAGSYDSVVYCSVCDAELSRETIPVDALGHDTINHEAQAPTCTEVGWEAYETCSRCDYTTYVEIPATGHNHVPAVTEPTCTEKGYTTYTCHCGDSYKGDEVPATGHDYKAKVTEPTCTEKGYTTYTCHCGDTYVADRVDAIGHNPAEAVVENNVAPTCTTAGSYDSVVYCSVCNNELSRETIPVDALGHDIVTDAAVAPGCEATGLTEGSHCSRCDDMTIAQTVVPATGHSWDDGVVTTPSTCTESGVKTYTCGTCGDTKTEDVGALGHDEIHHAGQDPTCTEIGWGAYVTCSRCDYTTYNELPVRHTSGDDYVCTICGEIDWGNEVFTYTDVYNSDYGYNYLGTMQNGENLQELYEEIEQYAKLFHVQSSFDAAEDGVFAIIPYDTLGISDDMAVSVWKTFLDDNPLYYWMSKTVMYVESNIYIYAETEYIDGDVRVEKTTELYELIDQYLACAYENDSAYMKALCYHDQIIRNIDYAYDENGEPEEDHWAHSIVGVLDGKGAVCEGYARTFQLLLNANGIENVFVTGDGNGESHAWNLIKLDDGSWYWCDLTWDDATAYESGLEYTYKLGVAYTYFCVTDNESMVVSSLEGFGDSYTTFLTGHSADTTSGQNIKFLYELPERAETSYDSNEDIDNDIEFIVDGFTYRIIGYNTLEVVDCSIAGEANIPEKVEHNGREYSVESLRSIGANVTSLYIPKSILFIASDDRAFGGYECFEEFIVAEDNPKFTSLDGVLFTKSLYTLIAYPCGNPRTEYVIPDETYVIAYYAFSCDVAVRENNLTKLTIGKNVFMVGRASFGSAHLDAFRNLLGSNITGEFFRIFSDMGGNKTILIHPENTNFISDGVGIYSYGKSVLYLLCDEFATEYELPSTVNRVDDASVENPILNEYNCLKTISVEEGNSQFASYDGILYSKDYSTIVCVPRAVDGSVEIYEGVSNIKTTFFGREDLVGVIIPASVTSISSSAFSGCYSLTNVIFAEGSQLETIGEYAFSTGGILAGITSIIIPDSVTTIGNYAFQGCRQLTSVSFGENSQLTSIGDNAFMYCTSLTSITIPDGVSRIGSHAFCGCSSLTSVTFGENSQLTTIGWRAFSGCNSLTSVTFGENSQLTSIGDSAFEGCRSLTSITIPDGVTSIENRAFVSCSSLTSITIPTNVTTIENEAFYDCCCLVEVYNKSNLNIVAGSEDNGYVGYYALNVYTEEGGRKLSTDEDGFIIYTDGDDKILVGYVGDETELIIPDGIKEINKYAFRQCTRLTSIVIPDSVTTIGSYAFAYCDSLTNVTFGANSQLTTIGAAAFYGCFKLAEVYNKSSLNIVAGSLDYGYVGYYALNVYTEEGGSNLSTDEDGYIIYTDGEDKILIRYVGDDTNLVIPSDITQINARAFYNCDSLISVTIPDSVTSIGDWAFYDCDRLTSVTFGEDSQLTSIGYMAFYYCASLTSITIPDNITSIGEAAFSDCRSLTSIDIPDSVTSIGSSAFMGCDILTSVTFGENSQLTSIDDRAFYYCVYLTSITIPAGVTSIGEFAFSSCNSLTGITIPANVTNIGHRAFSDCVSLESISVVEGNTVYHSAGNCLILTAEDRLIQGSKKSVIPSDGSVTIIGEYAFYGCSYIRGIIIPASVTRIEEYAFTGCGLKTITFEENSQLISIGNGAFSWCQNLASLTIPASVTTVGEGAFVGCGFLTCLTFEENSQLTSISSSAFDGCSRLTTIIIPDSVTSVGTQAFNSCTRLTDVYYTGTEEEWNSITIDTGNDPLTNATIHYNYVNE